MNDIVSWDPSLIKKFSSSNHYKLLNQLRTEVKKYPLNNKKNSTTIHNNGINQENKNKESVDQSPKPALSKDSNKDNVQNSSKSNISFNNSKNFSIYNQANNNNFTRQINDHSKMSVESSPPSFKERLDQIDMK